MARALPTAAQISIVQKILEAGSFSGAALELDLTQSAVSRMVQGIEEQYGVELFVRGRKGATPTPAMKKLLPAFRQALQGLEELGRLLEHQDGVQRGRIRVASFRSAATQLLSQPLKTFMVRHPAVDLSLQVVREVDGGVLELLRNGEAEIGVTTDAPSRRLRSWPLARDEYVLVRERSKGRRRLDTKGATLILWKERCSAVVPQIANDMNWRPKKIVEVDSDAAVLSMVENGAGVTVMPRLATEPLSAGLEAERLPVTVYRQITLCTTAAVANSQAGRLLIQGIRRSVQQRFRSATDTAESERNFGVTISH